MPRTHRPFWPGLILFAVMSTCAAFGAVNIPGCSVNPVTAAQDTEQRAYAIYGTFVIVEEQGANIISSAKVPTAVVSAIKAADARAKPSADALLQAVRDYDAARHDLKTGTNTQADFEVAAAHLQQWVIQAQTDVSALVSAVKQGS